MTESIMNVKREEEEKKRKERLLEQRKQMEERAKKAKALGMVDSLKRSPSSSSTSLELTASKEDFFEDKEGQEEEEEKKPEVKRALSLKEREEIKAQRELNALLLQAWEGVQHVDSLHFDDLGYSEGCMGYYSRLAELCKVITEHPIFVNFVTAVIVMAGVVVGLQTDEDIVHDHQETLDTLDLFILIVFTVEVVLKLIAEESEPWNYFHSKWNVFDFIIVVGSFLPGGGSMLTMLRLLRLLRVLKLVKSLPQLAIIVNALIMGVSSIGFIGLILFLCFYMFAILGMIMFKENDPFHFGTLHMAMISLMQCATFDDWTVIAYINIYGCDVYGYDDAFFEDCQQPKEGGFLAALYFIAFVIVGSLVLFTLFIGVVTTSMDEATEKQKEAQEMEDRVKAYQKENGLHSSTIKLYKKAFSMLDLDGGGTIEEDELSFGLEAVGIEASGEEIQALMARVDEDESGEIDLAEFVEFMTIVCREKKGEEGEEEGEEESTNIKEEEEEEIELVEKTKLVSPRTGKVAPET
jgi:voltage-gated sodium channel